METRITLLREVSGGSEDAWAEFTELYQPLIIAWLRKFDLQSSDAEDLTQDVLTALFSSVENFGHNGRVGAFRAWLRTITQNTAADFLKRRSKRDLPLGHSSFATAVRELTDSGSTISQVFDRQHDLHLLSTLLGRVATEFQDSTMAVFRQHVIEGQQATKVAETFGVSRHGVYMAKSRVMRRLRELAPGFIEDIEREGTC